MARYKGHLADLTAGGSDIGECESFDITQSFDKAESKVIGNASVGADALQYSYSGTISVLRDPDDAGQTALVGGSKVSCVFYPEGNTSGRTSVTGSFLIESVATSVTADDLVKDVYTVSSDGDVTVGTVA